MNICIKHCKNNINYYYVKITKHPLFYNTTLNRKQYVFILPNLELTILKGYLDLQFKK